MNKKLFIILFLSAVFSGGALSSFAYSRNIFLPDEITVTYKTFTDFHGWTAGAEYYLTNNTDRKQRVKWSFSGIENATIDPDSGTTDVDPHATVMISTFKAVDILKPWDAGKIHIEWAEIK
ncbi:MAG: hypothetical protein ACHQJ4_01025 [Ignavibacteria bacterium]